MKRLVTTILSLMLLSHVSLAQNHVINGDFEYRSSCPWMYGHVSFCNNWRQYTDGTSDYFNACAPSTSQVNVPYTWFGYQQAASGQGYGGGFVYLPAPNFSKKEYLAGEMIPLDIGRPYEVSISVSLADSLSVATNDLGIFFYKDGPYTRRGSGVLNVTPQVSFSSYGPITDTANWVRLRKVFVADSSYSNLVIGGFMENHVLTTSVVGTGSTGYYFFDSVVVKPFDSLAINIDDTVYCVGDSIKVDLSIYDTASYTSTSVFKLQLSDANGSFGTPLTIGQAVGYLADTILTWLPDTLSKSSNYKVRLVNATGTTVSNDCTIEIYNKDSISMQLTSNAPICVRDTLSLIVSSDTSVTDYVWSGPSGFLSVSQDAILPSATINHNGTFYVSAKYYACSISDSIPVVINPAPEQPTAFYKDSICLGDTLMLTAICATSGVSFEWHGANNFSSTDQFPTQLNAGYIDTGYYFVSASKDGCTSLEDSVHVSVNSKYAIDIAANKDSICSGEMILFNVMQQISGGVHYHWYLNGQPVSGNNKNTFNSTQLNDGDTVMCIMADSVTCEAPYADSSNVIKAAVLPTKAPSVSIAVTQQGPTGQGTRLSFVAKPVDAGIPLYQWRVNGVDVPGAIGQIFSSSTLNDKDTVCLEIESAYMCASPLKAVSNCISITVVGVDNKNEIKELKLYPNPNAGQFVLEGRVSSAAHYDIQIVNALGHVVYTADVATRAGSIYKSMDVNLAPGVYLLTLQETATKQTQTIRLLIK